MYQIRIILRILGLSLIRKLPESLFQVIFQGLDLDIIKYCSLAEAEVKRSRTVLPSFAIFISKIV